MPGKYVLHILGETVYDTADPPVCLHAREVQSTKTVQDRPLVHQEVECAGQDFDRFQFGHIHRYRPNVGVELRIRP